MISSSGLIIGHSCAGGRVGECQEKLAIRYAKAPGIFAI